nr:hypothetical protein L204_00438 [Cryptococcus depauperatus CBS 7855]
MPPNASKTIFASPFSLASSEQLRPVSPGWLTKICSDVSEEQLASTFSEAGPVANVEIKFDSNTGRSKGYAFVQFYGSSRNPSSFTADTSFLSHSFLQPLYPTSAQTHPTDDATALSAVRNLQDTPINGRNLRVELSTDEPGPRRRGPAVPGTRPAPSTGSGVPSTGGTGYGTRYGDPNASAGQVGTGDVDLRYAPQGINLPPGERATDNITKTLATISPGQLQEVMESMKNLVTQNPESARQLLTQQPQLAYALFQAMLLLNIVDPSVLQSFTSLPSSAASAPLAPPAPAPHPGPGASISGYGATGPVSTGSYSGYGAPPPAAGGYGGPGGYSSQPQAQPPFRPPPPSSGYTGTPPQIGGYPPYGSAPSVPSYPPVTAPPPNPTPIPAPPASGMASLPPSAQAALSTLPSEQQVRVSLNLNLIKPLGL